MSSAFWYFYFCSRLRSNVMTNTSLSEGPIYCGIDSVCLGRYKISVRQSFPPAFNPIFSYMSLFLTPCPAKKIQSTQIIAVLLCHGAQSIVYWKSLLPGNKFRGLPRSFIEKKAALLLTNIVYGKIDSSKTKLEILLWRLKKISISGLTQIQDWDKSIRGLVHPKS